MKFALNFDCNNDVFAIDLTGETARILAHIADCVDEHGQTEGVVYDLNGNNIGSWRFAHDDWGQS